MDIQLPVMSGIEATKEIRRLERVNHIGVFSEETTDKPSPEDELGDLPFPSPVIIVALTASSRESDRNEALAAGCNDFLTKPVGAPWLERKAIEWGCMQALIWTSFERRRRRKEDLENNVVSSTDEENVFTDGVGGRGGGDKTKKMLETGGDGSESPEKPAVARGDSGESVHTQGSTSTDDGPQ
jgi:osomolarity two-component system, response regulator SSK1